VTVRALRKISLIVLEMWARRRSKVSVRTPRFAQGRRRAVLERRSLVAQRGRVTNNSSAAALSSAAWRRLKGLIQQLERRQEHKVNHY